MLEIINAALYSAFTIHNGKSTCHKAFLRWILKVLWYWCFTVWLRIYGLLLMLLLVLKWCLCFLFNVAECNSHTSPSPGIQVRHVYTPSTTKHFSPIKQSTTLTNKHRGNEVSTTPLLVNCKYPSALLLIIILWTVCWMFHRFIQFFLWCCDEL